ncbi:hypothetical protein AMEX_G2863 [Astyanax mexicanus]|uniref:Uncharacterized protein n=1 Tax=Astyanax mexicanus TaxID=7994 RepID=A0A8T2M764_ASTMX|nr:hypothetical protein AMEX_G2863 [Astyanax mexicanus]
MCVDTMVAEGRRKRADRQSWSKPMKKRFLYVNLVKAALRKYVEGKRMKMSHCRTVGRTFGHREEPQEAWRTDRLPCGAMAPRNTTQYLMDQAYSDPVNISTQQLLNDFERKSADVSRTEDEHFYSSLYSDEETMDFQQRDFENVYFLHEI